MRGIASRARARWAQFTLASRHPGRTIAALAALGVVSGLGEAAVVVLVVALASGAATDQLALVGHAPDGVWPRAGLALGVLAVLAAAHLASAWLTARATADSQERVRRQVVDAFVSAGWPTQSRERAGKLQDLLTTGAGAIAAGTQQLAVALTLAFNFAVVVAAALVVSVWVTVGLVAVGALSLLVVRPTRKRTHRLAGDVVQASGDLAGDATEMVALAPELRVAGSLGAARDRLAGQISATRRLFEALRLNALALPTAIRDITVGIVIVGVAVAVGRDGVSLPELGAAVLLLLRALSHVQGLSGIHAQLQERAAHLDRVHSLVERWRASAPPAGTRPYSGVPEVTIRSVDHTYAGAHRPALSDINLVIASGEQIGLIGPTGAGKSTLACLVLGLLTPDRGTVSIDGVDLRELRADDWHRSVAWVRQDPNLLTGTVRENVRFLRDWIDDDAVRVACETARLGPELEAWPLGLDHHVGPAGTALSGGQRQRVALARALAGDPGLLVLDEPTSAADPPTEAAIRDAIGALRGRATVVVIAHRLSTLSGCDRVAVLDGGRLTALGSPTELETADGYYRRALGRI